MRCFVLLVVVGCSTSTAVNPLERPVGTSAEAIRVRSAEAALAGPAAQRAAGWIALGTAWLQLGRLASDAHALELARAAADHALTIEPRSGKALVLKATLLQAGGDFVQARAIAARIVAMNPQDAAAWGVLGDAELALGSSATAFAAYDKLMGLSPGIPAYTRAAYARYLVGDIAGSLAMYEAAARSGHVSEPEPLAFTAVGAGDVLASSGDMSRAGDAYAAALRLVPAYPDAVFGRARLALARHDYASATDDFAALLTTDRGDDALPLLAVALAGAL